MKASPRIRSEWNIFATIKDVFKKKLNKILRTKLFVNSFFFCLQYYMQEEGRTAIDYTTESYEKKSEAR